MRVHGTKFFLGLKLGYEYLKPEAFYFGIDILAAGANHGFHESFKGHHIPQSDGLTGFGFFLNFAKLLKAAHDVKEAYKKMEKRRTQKQFKLRRI